MTSGPSKAELQDYWKNNRQYFDELARYYLESDKEYYDKYIAPFYSQVFQSSSSIRRGGSGRIILIVIALFAVIGAAGVAMLVMFQGGSDSGSDNNTTTPNVIRDTVQKIENTPSVKQDTTAKIVQTNSPYYDKAMKYYREKDYDAAEQYFNLIEKNDKNYMNAQKRLFEIKMIRNGDYINGDAPVEPKNNNRKQPLERIR